MVYKHIVMWKFKEQHNGKSALENARWMKEQLEALVGVVPELLSAEVGISPALEQAAAVPSDAAAAAETPSPVAAQSNAAAVPAQAASGEYDACLVSTFASPEALAAYKVHPKHKAISAYCKEARLKRLAFDWWSEE